MAVMAGTSVAAAGRTVRLIAQSRSAKAKLGSRKHKQGLDAPGSYALAAA